MNNNWIRKGIGILLLVTFLCIPFLTPIQTYLSIPSQITTFNNTEQSISLPVMGNAVSVHSNESNQVIEAINSSEFQTLEAGSSDIVYEMAGIPVKRVNVEVLDDFRIIPGGQSIGVNLQTLGVLVVGHHLVDTNEGEVSPGEEAGIQVGDTLLSINGQKINNMKEVTPFVNEAGEKEEPLHVEVKREDKTFKTELKPYLDSKDNSYRIGLYIRDSAAGIGTMTFYDPKSKKYGALGHVISDMDTRKPIEINNGTIVKSNIKSIDKGQNGNPGEKQAEFSAGERQIGNITKNSPFGVFGKLDRNLSEGYMNEPMPITLPHEVKEGPAKILTVVEGEEVKEFDVEVVNSVNQKYPATKGMIIKITDKELLDKTGGIVQGMSGSPIIQDGKVIGAVTHVFVNDPTSGYGVHIEWMLHEAGIDIYKGEQEKAS
ncbi:SpoIVB peptidase [Aquibacillus koreensis]|uniref:SpoIVB peptidase n=1 Tax=Aquibacillus koreensis TaxID=279446 RepID=A0A9X3WHZ5_9BACI|nr:SpoIVB peptidase [Aquibacillus koreensis]MCT2537507.1 SpoIVB peptidase [Aquibacillus koreensis]MDC3418953.1 SpoIVB peptidase [Aquibacillus koreensis]